LDPILVMALAGGPIKAIPSLSSCSAKSAFSLRKPYLEARLLMLGGRRMCSTRDVWPAGGIVYALIIYSATIHHQRTYLRPATMANLNYLIYPQLPGLLITSHSIVRLGHAHNFRKIGQDLYSMLHPPTSMINREFEAER
jgi:hypothetical protein